MENKNSKRIKEKKPTEAHWLAFAFQSFFLLKSKQLYYS